LSKNFGENLSNRLDKTILCDIIMSVRIDINRNKIGGGYGYGNEEYEQDGGVQGGD
jgi:hypothetical protein